MKVHFFFLEHKLRTAPTAFTYYYIRKSLAIKSERERERDVSLVVCSLVKLWIPTIYLYTYIYTVHLYKFTDYKLAVEFGRSVFFPGNKTAMPGCRFFYYYYYFPISSFTVVFTFLLRIFTNGTRTSRKLSTKTSRSWLSDLTCRLVFIVWLKWISKQKFQKKRF